MTRVGILGGGQLGRMLALAGYPLGLRFRVLDPGPNAGAGRLAEHVVAEYDDDAALEGFARDLCAVTYEFENVPVATARMLGRSVPVHPGPRALEVAQDRWVEKNTFRELGIGTAPFARVDDRPGLDDALDRIGTPAVLKTRRFGYDGKGQALIREPGDADEAWEAVGGVPLILEGYVDFHRELSALAVRSRTGETALYPLVENHHTRGILHVSLAPAPGETGGLRAQAAEKTGRLLTELEYVGVLAVEFFQVGDVLLANEMAPRVHNSGHWSIEGAVTSQFENHLRAVLGHPLGSVELRGHAAMVNLLGSAPEPAEILDDDGTHLHLYDKSSRPGRKLGHATVVAPTADDRDARLEVVRGRLRDLGVGEELGDLRGT